MWNNAVAGCVSTISRGISVVVFGGQHSSGPPLGSHSGKPPTTSENSKSLLPGAAGSVYRCSVKRIIDRVTVTSATTQLMYIHTYACMYSQLGKRSPDLASHCMCVVQHQLSSPQVPIAQANPTRSAYHLESRTRPTQVMLRTSQASPGRSHYLALPIL